MTVIKEFLFGLGFTKVDPKPLDEAEKKARDAAKRMRDEWRAAAADIGKSLTIAAGAALGAGVGLFKLAESSARAADEIGDTAVALGVASRELQRLRHGMLIAGGNVDGFDKAIKRWTDGLSDAAAKGVGPVVDRLDQLGLSAGELVGLGLEDQIGIIADRFQGLASEQEKAAIAADLFGSKADIKQLLERNSAGVRELGDEAERLGLVLGQDALDAAGDFTDSIDRMKAQVGAIVRDVGLSLIPVIQEVIEKVRAWVMENRELLRSRAEEFVRMLANALQQLLPALTTLLPLLAKLVEHTAKLTNAAGPAGATAAVVALRGALSGSLGPIGAVTAAIALLVSTVITAAEETQNLQFALDDLKSGGRGKRGEGTRKLVSEREGELQASRRALVQQLEVVEAAGGKRMGDAQTSGFRADQRDRAKIIGQIKEIDRAIAAEVERANEKAAFDADVQRRSNELEQRIQARIDANNAKARADRAGKKGKGKSKTFDAEFDEYDFAFDELAGEQLRKLAEEAGVGDVAFSAAIKAGGESLRSGSTQAVALQAARSRLGSLTGRDYSKQKDPLLSEIFGEDVPDMKLSELALGASPQTLVVNITNNFDTTIQQEINGAGNPAEVGGQIARQVREELTRVVGQATRTVKVRDVR